MTQQEARENEIRRIHELSKSFSKVDFKEQTRDDELGTALGFGPLIPDLTELKALVSSLQAIPLHVLPSSTLTQVVGELEAIREVFDQIARFDVNQPNAQGTHDELLETLRQKVWNREASIFNLVQPAYVANLAADERLERVLASTEATVARISAAATSAEDALDRVTEVESAVREAAAQSGVSRHAKDFAELAEGHVLRSRWALGAAAVFALALVLVLLWSTPSSQGNRILDSPYNLLHQLAAPVVLVTGLLVSLKVFTAERHNVVVNRHRATALSTFHSFVEGTENPVIREAILLQATNCIFSHQSTGYTKAPLEGQTVPLGLLGSAARIGDNE